MALPRAPGQGSRGWILTLFGADALIFAVRHLRVVILLVVALTLPGYGLADLAHVRACPNAMGDMGAHAMSGHGCCPGAGGPVTSTQHAGGNRSRTTHRSGSPCNSPFCCKVAQPLLQLNAIAPPLGATRPSMPDIEPLRLEPSSRSDGLWRPPRLI